MLKRLLFCLIASSLLLGGCVSVPDRHTTAGKYNELGDMNTECLAKDSIMPRNTPAAALHIGGLDSRRFRVLNWNSHKGKDQAWQDDLERLMDQSDLVVLQEGYLTDDLQDLFSRKRYHWDIAKAFIYNDIYTGVLTASMIKPDFLCSFRVPEPLSSIPKTALITRYPLSGTEASLVMVNIHMINFSFDLSAYRAQLEKIAGIVSQHRGPLIIAGDFNSWNNERMRVLTEITQELGLIPVAYETDHRAMFMRQRVDHIFYRQLVPLEALTEKVTSSDHNPMLVTFRLTEDK